MTAEPDNIDYEQFLDTWQPTRHLKHATLPQSLSDPLARARLQADSAGCAEVPRRLREQAMYNGMAADEMALRHLDFFQQHQGTWASEFRDRLVSGIVRAERADRFIRAMAEHWVDGSNRRQGHPDMVALKAAIGWHDERYNREHAGKYVIHAFDRNVEPMFEPEEMATVFDANEKMLEIYIPDYLDRFNGNGPTSINWLYVRRGVCMPHQPKPHLEELHYLSSYSLASGPVELFAQTQGREKCGGHPCIFSAPLPAVQHRTVAFAPFIKGMQLDQMELVSAPPSRPTALRYHGKYGEPSALIAEYTFE